MRDFRRVLFGRRRREWPEYGSDPPGWFGKLQYQEEQAVRGMHNGFMYGESSIVKSDPGGKRRQPGSLFRDSTEEQVVPAYAVRSIVCSFQPVVPS